MYRARRTLIFRFDNDGIDESESLYKVQSTHYPT